VAQVFNLCGKSIELSLFSFPSRSLGTRTKPSIVIHGVYREPCFILPRLNPKGFRPPELVKKNLRLFTASPRWRTIKTS
jgi:hypothetical protein